MEGIGVGGAETAQPIKEPQFDIGEVGGAKGAEPKGPVSISDLHPGIQAELKVIQTDPNKSFGINFHAEHIRFGTSDAEIDVKQKFEARILADMYLRSLEACGGEKTPADAKQLLNDAIIEALEARGITITTLADIKKITKGPRHDEVLDLFSGDLREKIAIYFDQEGDVRDPASISPQEAAMSLGFVRPGQDINQVIERFGSLKGALGHFQDKLNDHSNAVISALKDLPETTRAEALGLLTPMMNHAAQKVAKAAEVHFEHVAQPTPPPIPKPEEDKKQKTDDRKVDPDKETKPKDDKIDEPKENKEPPKKVVHEQHEPPVLKPLTKPSIWKALGLGALSGGSVWGYCMAVLQPALHATLPTAAAVGSAAGTWAAMSIGAGVGGFALYFGFILARNGYRAIKNKIALSQTAGQAG